MKFRKACPDSVEGVCKFVALLCREVLVLTICCGACEPLSDIAFEHELEKAFKRAIGPEMRSQFRLSRAAICRMGVDRSSFEKEARKIYGVVETQEEQLDAIFRAY